MILIAQAERLLTCPHLAGKDYLQSCFRDQHQFQLTSSLTRARDLESRAVKDGAEQMEPALWTCPKTFASHRDLERTVELVLSPRSFLKKKVILLVGIVLWVPHRAIFRFRAEFATIFWTE